MRRLGVGQLVGSFFFLELASAMMLVALPLLMVERYGFGVRTGVVLALGLMPQLLFAGFVGVAINRYDSRHVAIVSALAAATLIMLFPLSRTIAQVGILAFLTGTTFVFGIPARMALRPRVMAAGSEVRGNSLIVGSERFALTLGPALGALLVAGGGIELLFYAVAIAMVGAAMFLLGIRTMVDDVALLYDASPPRFGTWLQQLFVEPIREFRELLLGESLVAALTVTAFGYVTAVGASRLLLTSRANTLFGMDSSLGFLVAAMAAGGVVGAIIGGRLGHLRQGHIYIVGNICEAIYWPLVALLQDRVVVLLIMVAAGVFESIATVVYFAEVQTRLSPAALGTYYALLIPLTQTCGMLGALGGSVLLEVGGALPLGIVMACLIGMPVLARGRILLRADAGEPIAEAHIAEDMA
jgi:ENTS family enterobactin (siderophore) exporter